LKFQLSSLFSIVFSITIPYYPTFLFVKIVLRSRFGQGVGTLLHIHVHIRIHEAHFIWPISFVTKQHDGRHSITRLYLHLPSRM